MLFPPLLFNLSLSFFFFLWLTKLNQFIKVVAKLICSDLLVVMKRNGLLHSPVSPKSHSLRRITLCHLGNSLQHA